MAQLPPKAPTTMAFHHPNPNPNPNPNPPSSWVDDFLDFTSARRGSHRRSISDSITFLETPSLLHTAAAFDRFDDDQLMSMFSDDLPENNNTSSSAVPALHSPNSSNSDNNNTTTTNNNNNTLPPPVTAKTEMPEVQSPCNNDDVDADADAHRTNSGDSSVDPKRVKRILANRQSAQRSRVRKLQYISELERSVTSLQTEVSALSPRVAFLDHQRLILNVDNSALKQRIAALAQDKIFKDAHQEALKKEIERLRQIYHQQNMKKPTGEQAADNNTPLADQKMQLMAS